MRARGSGYGVGRATPKGWSDVLKAWGSASVGLRPPAPPGGQDVATPYAEKRSDAGVSLRLLRRSFRAARPRRLPGKDWHVAIVVENVPLGTDPRLRKQVDQLLAAGHRVSVVTMRDSSNRVYRDRRGMRLLEYPSRREADGPLGHVGEYASAFAWATLRLGALRARGRIDVLQVCQPPDIYFPLARLLRWTGTRVVVDQRDLMPELVPVALPRRVAGRGAGAAPLRAADPEGRTRQHHGEPLPRGAAPGGGRREERGLGRLERARPGSGAGGGARPTTDPGWHPTGRLGGQDGPPGQGRPPARRGR